MNSKILILYTFSLLCFIRKYITVNENTHLKKMPIKLEDLTIFYLTFSWESGTKTVKIFLDCFSVTPLQDENLKIVYIWNENEEYSIRALLSKVFT